jgi:2-haloacid dehalogenase
MSLSSDKHVVFDVEGTLVSHDRVYKALDDRLGDKLRRENIKPALLGYTWFEVAEREYTYCSMSDNYVPFVKVLRFMFYRILHMAGVEHPRQFCSDDDVEYLMGEYANLELRPGAEECLSILRDNGYQVWCFTCADPTQVKGYFDKAGVEMPKEHVLDCDGFGIAKPALEPYRRLLETHFAGLEEKKVWFAAAHMWDAAGARKAGYVSTNYMMASRTGVEEALIRC